MGLGVVCSAIVLILLVVLGYIVKRAQDRKLERLSRSIERIETRLGQPEQRLDDVETRPGEKRSK